MFHQDFFLHAYFSLPNPPDSQDCRHSTHKDLLHSTSPQEGLWPSSAELTACNALLRNHSWRLQCPTPCYRICTAIRPCCWIYHSTTAHKGHSGLSELCCPHHPPQAYCSQGDPEHNSGRYSLSCYSWWLYPHIRRLSTAGYITNPLYSRLPHHSFSRTTTSDSYSLSLNFSPKAL